jgi:hypothetical protein
VPSAIGKVDFHGGVEQVGLGPGTKITIKITRRKSAREIYFHTHHALRLNRNRDRDLRRDAKLDIGLN